MFFKENYRELKPAACSPLYFGLLCLTKKPAKAGFFVKLAERGRFELPDR
jgi:hypothetical protein